MFVALLRVPGIEDADNDAGAGLTAESIMAAVNERVTPYKRLRDVVFIDAIPVSAAGKVVKRALVEGAAAGSP